MTDPAVSRVLHPRRSVAAACVRLGAEVSARHPSGVVLVAVLPASLLFVADLARHVAVDCQVDFLAVSAYTPGTGRVRIVKDLDVDVAGRAVVIVETLVDTGLTCSYVVGELQRRSPTSVEVCALLDRRARRIVPVDVTYVGFDAPDALLVGYGLDVAGRYRNLPFVAVADQVALAADPDAAVPDLYGR